MIVTIHQPDFLPWLGFFDRWRKSGLYIVLDDVQFLRRGWHHRDKIMTASGPAWFTVPIFKKGKYSQFIKDVEIDNTVPWQRRHLRAIEYSYKRAPNFNYCFEKLQAAYNKKYSFLIDLNMELLRFAAEILGIITPLVYASSFNIREKGSERLISLLKAVNSDTYLTGLGSRDYLDEMLFRKEQIKVVWQEYKHPVYPQLHGNFTEKLSVLDYLMAFDNRRVAKAWLDE